MGVEEEDLTSVDGVHGWCLPLGAGCDPRRRAWATGPPPAEKLVVGMHMPAVRRHRIRPTSGLLLTATLAAAWSGVSLMTEVQRTSHPSRVRRSPAPRPADARPPRRS